MPVVSNSRNHTATGNFDSSAGRLAKADLSGPNLNEGIHPFPPSGVVSVLKLSLPPGALLTILRLFRWVFAQMSSGGRRFAGNSDGGDWSPGEVSSVRSENISCVIPG